MPTSGPPGAAAEDIADAAPEVLTAEGDTGASDVERTTSATGASVFTGPLGEVVGVTAASRPVAELAVGAEIRSFSTGSVGETGRADGESEILTRRFVDAASDVTAAPLRPLLAAWAVTLAGDSVLRVGPALAAECAADGDSDEFAPSDSAAADHGQAAIARPTPLAKTADVRRALVADCTAHLPGMRGVLATA